jgi:hypothetical protein
MTVVVPPPHDESELLIREARARQRKRWVGAAALVAVLAGGALAIHSIATGTRRGTPVSSPGGARAAVSRSRCGVKVVGTRILVGDGSVAYREPAKSAMWHELQCSGPTVWVIFGNGVGMMHEEYVGVRSLDRGQTWRVAFAQDPGVPARHGIGAEVGPWALVGRRTAYFVSACPACEGFGTFSLSVTGDAGRTFQTYHVPGSDAYAPQSILVRGHRVEIRERRVRGFRSRWRTVVVHTA